MHSLRQKGWTSHSHTHTLLHYTHALLHPSHSRFSPQCFIRSSPKGLDNIVQLLCVLLLHCSQLADELSSYVRVEGVQM